MSGPVKASTLKHLRYENDAQLKGASLTECQPTASAAASRASMDYFRRIHLQSLEHDPSELCRRAVRP